MNLSNLKKLITLILLICIAKNTFSQTNSDNTSGGNKKDKKVTYALITELFYLKKESNPIPDNYVQSTMSFRVINGFQINKIIK